MSEKTNGPLPWHAVEIGRNDVKAPVMVVRDAQGHAVAEYLAEDDANYIVFCANLHGDLVQGLRDALDWLDDGNRQLSDACMADVERARTALSRASGQKKGEAS